MPGAYALFSTSIGVCAVSWSDRGVTTVQLPEASEDRTRARIRQRAPDAYESEPPPAIADAIAGIVALLAGRRNDLAGVVLDMDEVPAFHRRVYEIARTIAPGQTRTYGEIAAALGDPGAARAVGQALGDNPFPIVVPCHRVLAAAGKPGGFSAYGGRATKRQLLVIEGAIPAQGQLFPNGGP
jgi:methylated-DNA-[protein]-cysteine S-methyltransferase